MMNSRSLLTSGALLLFLAIFLSGCMQGPRSETIVIPSKEETHTDELNSRPFQVKAIYRFINTFAETDQMLGWSATDSVIGLFRKASTTEGVTWNLGRLPFPYEKLKLLKKIDANTDFLELSPDGKKISKMAMSASGASLKLISLPDGKETEVVIYHSSQNLYLQDVGWSNNSRYVCFLIIDASMKGNARVGVYDNDSGSYKTYQLKDIDRGRTLTGVNISDDGHSVLLTLFENKSNRSNRIVMGMINGSEITVQYEHQTGREQNAWLNNDQFVYLGTDGTLYEYDRRTSELTVLLDKVSNFEFSRDRKYVAYSLYDKDTILVGKLQGKNVLYEEPVYHGVIPLKIFWSPDNKSLLIHGRKYYSSVQGGLVESNTSDEPPFVLTFQ
ncbi:WD40 repeat domain-containing protein [Brevibacillus laterosporus]|uniref:WD40 repeat domain-containing protein n=1 Tax=Brevibacillus laterosporus TaxID=1465 RepID=UPI0035A65549